MSHPLCYNLLGCYHARLLDFVRLAVRLGGLCCMFPQLPLRDFTTEKCVNGTFKSFRDTLRCF
jgi:hypothetical protein